MAANFSATVIPHHPSDTTHHLPFSTHKRLTISCNSAKRATAPQEQNKTPSLAEQLKPLSTTTLADQPNKAQLSSKPKPIWVNPTKRKPSVVSPQRHQRSSYVYNPQIKDLKQFATKLSNCPESEFLAVLDKLPHDPTRDNVLLVLNCLRPWQKVVLFFDWVKSQNLFPMETIFYNVAMKSLRYGREFQRLEELAYEMVGNGVELDNITYSTIISCAKRCNLFDKAVEWFERMYKTGLMPDEVTYSAVLDVYAKIGKVEEVMSLYDRGRASGWKPDAIAFAVLAKMFGEAGDYEGIRFVFREMETLGVQPNLVVYNTLLEALGKAGKPGLARSLFEDMVSAGIEPSEKTLTALIKIYGKARWAKDAIDLWERMRANGWPIDFILYNTLLSMCADLGLVEEAESLFEDMKRSEHKPDSWSYTAMLNIYGSEGNAEKAMVLFKEIFKVGVGFNVMGCTCLIQCLGRSKKIDDLVMVFEKSLEAGIKPDDRLSGCLLSVVSYCEVEEADKVLACLERANPKLVALVKMLIGDDSVNFDVIKEEFKDILGKTDVDARRPFCNCLIDICRNKNRHEKAHELLYMGSIYGLYPGLHTKTEEEWRLNVRSLSVGAAFTAFEEWMGTLAKIVQREEALPALFTANTGTGTHKFSQGLGNALAAHVEKLAIPFRESDEKAGFFVATREDLISWVQSNAAAATSSAMATV